MSDQKSQKGGGQGKADSYAQEEGIVEVTATVLGKTERKPRRIKIRPFVTNPAHVSMSFGTSFETGDGKWIKANAFISMPCYKEEVETVFKKTSELVDRLLDEEIKRITGDD